MAKKKEPYPIDVNDFGKKQYENLGFDVLAWLHGRGKGDDVDRSAFVNYVFARIEAEHKQRKQ